MCEGNCKDCEKSETEHDKGRRKVLSWSVGIINLAVIAGIFAPVAGFIGSPLKNKAKDDWIDVLGENEIEVGETKEVKFKTMVEDGYQTVQREYVVFMRRYPDKIVVFDPSCTHLGCRVLYKKEQGRYLCPCHGGVFDEDGKVVSGPPPQALVKHGVRVENGRILVNRRAGIGA